MGDVSPHMDFSVEFTISDKGIQVEYTSDQYPSYGIRITQDDNEISTIIVKDAKGASANDFSTTMNMVSNTNYGSYFVPNAESEVGVQNNKSRSLAFSFVEEEPVVAGFAQVSHHVNVAIRTSLSHHVLFATIFSGCNL